MATFRPYEGWEEDVRRLLSERWTVNGSNLANDGAADRLRAAFEPEKCEAVLLHEAETPYIYRAHSTGHIVCNLPKGHHPFVAGPHEAHFCHHFEDDPDARNAVMCGADEADPIHVNLPTGGHCPDVPAEAWR